MPRIKREPIHLDFIPPHESIFSKMEESLGSLARFYGFERIRTSPLEDLYTLNPLVKAGFFHERPPVLCRTRASVQAFLRPSGAIGTLRAYASHRMQELPHPVKLFFQGEAYHTSPSSLLSCTPEWGVTIIGDAGPIAEAEVVQVIWRALKELGADMSRIELRVNETGCSQCRAAFRLSLMPYLRARSHRLCKNCKRNLRVLPSEIFLCSEEQCHTIANQAPQVLDSLCDACRKHLKGLLEFLDEASIPYFLDSKFFRDGSWYTSTLFEFVPFFEEGNAEGGAPATIRGLALGEGGRVSRAAELLGGGKVDAVSGVVFLQALAKTFQPKENKKSTDAQDARVFLAHLGELAKRRSLGVLEELRKGGIPAQESLGRDAIKSQLKVAERVGAQIALILGHKEALDGTIIVREVQSGVQETIPQEKLVEFLKKKLKK